MSKVVNKISLQEYLERQESMGGNKRKRGPVPIANNDDIHYSDIQDSQTHIGVSKRPCLDMTNDFNVQYTNISTDGPTTDNASPLPRRPLPPTPAPPPCVGFPPTTRESANPPSSAYMNMINIHVGGAPSQPHYRTFPVYSGLISYYSSHFATWLQMRSAQLDGLRLETDDPVVFEVFLGWLNDKKIVGPDAPTWVDGDGDKISAGDEESEVAYHHQSHHHYPDYHVQHGAQEEDKSTTLGFALLFKLHVFATKYEIPLFANEVINAALRTTIRFWSRPSSESVWFVYDKTDPASDVDSVADGNWEGLMREMGSLLRKFCVDVFCLTHTPHSATSTQTFPPTLPATAATYLAAGALSGTDSTTTAHAPTTTEQPFAGQSSQNYTRGRPLLGRAKACAYPNAFLLDCVNEFSSRLPVFTPPFPPPPPPPPPMASATPTYTATQGPYNNGRPLGRTGLQNLDWCVWHVHPPGVRCREQVEKLEMIRVEEEREWTRLQEEKEREWFRVQEEERTRLQEEEGRRRQQRAWDPNFDYGGSSRGSGGGGGGRQYGGHEYGGRGGGQGRNGGYGRDGGYNRGGQYRNREGGGERWNNRNARGGDGYARDRRGGGIGGRSSQGGSAGVGRCVKETW